MEWFIETPIALILIAVVVFGIVLIASLWLAIRKLTASSITVKAWQEQNRALLVIFLILLAILGIASLILTVAFELDPVNSFFIAILLLSFAFILFAAFNWLKNISRSGNTLLDIAPFPNRQLTITISIFILVLSLFIFLVLVSSDMKTGYSLFIVAIMGLFGAYNIFLASSRIQIRENGVLLYMDFLHWDRFEDICWTSDSQAYALKVRYKAKLPSFLRSGIIIIPLEKKDSVEMLLSQHLSGSVLKKEAPNHHLHTDAGDSAV